MTDSVTDYEAAYRELRLRLTDLLRERPDDELEQVTPTCPEWRVRDLPAHLGGVCDDIAHGNMDGVATDAPTPLDELVFTNELFSHATRDIVE